MAEDSFWRKDEPVLDAARRVVKGGMFEHQRVWWSLPNFVKALITGYGGGKTFIAAKRAISLALHNAPAPHASVSPTYKMARRTIVPAIRALLEGKARMLSGFSYSYNRSDFEFIIRYKGRVGTIWVLSGQEPDSLKGPNIGSCGIDEPFIQSREVFNQMLARVRDPSAKLREISLTGTPEELNWGYDICEGEEKGKFDIGYVQAPSYANSVLPEDYVPTLQSAYTAKAAQAFVEGKFVSLADGLVYYAFGEHNVVDRDTPPPGSEVFVGMDFNVNPMAAVVGWMLNDQVHIFDEIELPNADTEFMGLELRERYGQRIDFITPDASGRARSTNSPGAVSDFHILEDLKFELDVPSSNPMRKDRYNAVNAKFKSAKGETSLTISPKCKKLKRYLMGYDYEGMNKKKDMSHLLDAFGYPIVHRYPLHERTYTLPVQGT